MGNGGVGNHADDEWGMSVDISGEYHEPPELFYRVQTFECVELDLSGV